MLHACVCIFLNEAGLAHYGPTAEMVHLSMTQYN